jgi:hypothetical protein
MIEILELNSNIILEGDTKKKLNLKNPIFNNTINKMNKELQDKSCIIYGELSELPQKRYGLRYRVDLYFNLLKQRERVIAVNNFLDVNPIKLVALLDILQLITHIIRNYPQEDDETMLSTLYYQSKKLFSETYLSI